MLLCVILGIVNTTYSELENKNQDELKQIINGRHELITMSLNGALKSKMDVESKEGLQSLLKKHKEFIIDNIFSPGGAQNKDNFLEVHLAEAITVIDKVLGKYKSQDENITSSLEQARKSLGVEMRAIKKYREVPTK